MPSVFVDTNVILYARDLNAPEKRAAAQGWLRTLAGLKAVILSRQVINEAYFNLIRRRHFALTPQIARAAVAPLEAFVRAPSNAQTLREAWELEDRYGLSFWDALLMASANAVPCSHFLSEDLNDGQLYGNVRVINPFRHAPQDVLGRPAPTP